MKVLLHVCCAPDGTTAFKRLMEKGYEVWGYFHNPNIHPKSEYERRLDSFYKLVRMWNLKYVDAPYDPSKWFERVRGLEDEPEGGKRCEVCIRYNLTMTALKAKELGFDCFATSLTNSPHKNLDMINSIGEDVERETGVTYLKTFFRKKDGFLWSVIRSRELGLYRQDYCGCIFSLKEKIEDRGRKVGEGSTGSVFQRES